MAIDDSTKQNEERVTLTQRRAGASGSAPSAAKFDKSKYQQMNKEPEVEGGSAAKVVIWVIIVVILAVAAYLGLRSVLKSPSTNNNTTTPTPTATVSLEDKLIAPEVLADNLAVALQGNSAFVLTDQKIGKISTVEYEIQGVLVQKYTSFTRFQFTVKGPSDATELFPETTASYSFANTLLTLTFNNINPDNSGLGYGDSIKVNTSNVDTLTHNGSTTGKVEEYVLKMIANDGFVLHTTTDNGSNLVILDVKEKAVSITLSPTVAVTTTTIPATPSASQQTSDLQTQFSSGTQEINTGTTGNQAQTIKFNYSDASDVFTWNLYLNVASDKYPNVKGRIEDSKLIIDVQNYAKKGDGSIVYSNDLNGVKDLDKVEVTIANNVATYTFYLQKTMQYRMLFDQINNILKFEIKH